MTSDVASVGTARAAAIGTGLLRIAAGTMLWRAPDGMIRAAGGSDRDPLLRGLFRYFAVRDVALGVASVAAARPGADVPRVVRLQGVADVIDGATVGVLVTAGRFSRGRGTGALVLAAGSAFAEFALASWLRRR
jgi:hypothetical protein